MSLHVSAYQDYVNSKTLPRVLSGESSCATLARANTHTHTHTHTHTSTHARTHAHTHACTHAHTHRYTERENQIHANLEKNVRNPVRCVRHKSRSTRRMCSLLLDSLWQTHDEIGEVVLQVVVAVDFSCAIHRQVVVVVHGVTPLRIRQQPSFKLDNKSASKRATDE